jgi:hypothetical protein
MDVRLSAPRPPAPGPRRTVQATPDLAVGAARRTMSTDMTRPDGLRGGVVVVISGRDVVRAEDGMLQVVDEIGGRLEVDAATGTVGSAALDGGRSPVPDLAGLSLRRGWGRSLSAALPDDGRSLLGSVLEDLGGAFLVSGYALLHAGVLDMPAEEGARRADAQQDICIGWAADGDVVATLRTTGVNALPVGPQAAPGLIADDRWHRLDEPDPRTVRRLRRLDVRSGTSGPVAQAHFRDSYASDGSETVMHEYVVDPTVDADGTITAIRVDARVLPWNSCPGAVPSAQRIVGATLHEIPAHVRRELTGPTTCTHLNSTLRSIADIGHLLTLTKGGQQ